MHLFNKYLNNNHLFAVKNEVIEFTYMMMKNLNTTLSVLIAFLLFSCGELRRYDEPKNQQQVGLKEMTQEEKDLADEDFVTFWSEFRADVLKGDSNDIKGHIEFPVIVYGKTDADPILEINKEHFWQILELYMRSETHDEKIKEKNIDYLTRNEPLPQTEYVPKLRSQRIGDLMFHKNKEANSPWKLSEMYLDTKGLDKIYPIFQ